LKQFGYQKFAFEVYFNGLKDLMSEKHIYKVVFVNREQVYEVYAKSVYQGDMYGFVIVEDFVFGEKSTIVLDPGEDKLRAEFEGVKRSFIPIHEIVRIDQVERRGVAKIISEKQSSGGAGKISSLYVPEKK
jgi:hypothetical protein